MNISNFFAIALISTVSASAMANQAPVAPGSRAEEVANVASQVLDLKDVKIGKLKYRFVTMDTALNGDISSTTMLLVGEGEVGGAAGYDAAFQLSPTDEISNLSSVRAQSGAVRVSFLTVEGKTIVKTIRYDERTRTLLEK